MRKPRILYVGEFSMLNTGYATISYNLLYEIYKSGKYELLELAGYCKDSEPVHQQMKTKLPWRVVGVLPNNPSEDPLYKSHPSNEFGRWKFEQTCLDFQPDIVFDIRDYWMHSFIDQSIFRRIYKTILMPTLDGDPLNNEWVDLYNRTDRVLTYTEWAERLLRKQSGGLSTICGTTSPCVDTNVFKFVANRRAHKEQYGIRGDSMIVGIVARNQRRKLYPDLAKSFVDFLHRLDLKNTENLFLYWHTSYPDVGWDIPHLIKEHGLSHKVLMTYFCQNCRRWFPSFYQDAATVCRFCGQKSATLSNSHIGVDKEALAAVYGFIDFYAQHVLTEGFGVPHLEAAACGCVTAGTDYGGSTDILEKTNGYVVPVQRFYLEAETGRHMALPDNGVLTDYIQKFFALPESIRAKLSFQTAELARKHYGGWERVAAKWMSVFDGLPLADENPWLTTPIDVVNTDGVPCPGPDKMNDEQFVSWVLSEVLHRSDWINSYAGLKMLRDLGWGRTVTNNLGLFAGELSSLGCRPDYAAFRREDLLKQIVDLRQQYNYVENARHSYINSGIIKSFK